MFYTSEWNAHFLHFLACAFVLRGCSWSPSKSIQNLTLTATQLGVGEYIIMKFIMSTHNQSAIFAWSSPGRRWWGEKNVSVLYSSVFTSSSVFMLNIWMINNLLIFCNRKPSIYPCWKSYYQDVRMGIPNCNSLVS